MEGHTVYKHKAFTLIEMVVVIGIIILITSMVVPAVSTMWNQTHLENANQKISSLIRVARTRSLEWEHFSYGVLFYINPEERQVATFIDGKMHPDSDLGETHNDVCDRFEIHHGERSYVFEDFVRLAPPDILDWLPDEQINDDYRLGKQRNFFAIIFQRGEKSHRPFILWDEDSDGDGFGEETGLTVGDVVTPFGNTLTNIVSNNADELIEVEPYWGFLVYDESLFKDLRSNVDLVEFIPYGLTGFGQVVLLESN